MIELVLSHERLRLNPGVIVWAFLFVICTKFAAAAGSPTVTLAWLGLSAAICFILPIRYLVATIVATVVFLDASLWFLGDRVQVNTIYEVPGAFVKPPELLLLTLAARLLFIRNLIFDLPRSVTLAVFLWVSIVLVGGATATVYGRSTNDILIFSELRSPIIMTLGVFALYPIAKCRMSFLVDALGIFVLTHFAISLLSWAAGISVLWQSYAPNYAGSQSAFFGADESVIVYLLAFAISLALGFGRTSGQITELGGTFWRCIFAVTSFAIIASLRRGGVAAAGIVGLGFFVFSSVGTKLRILGAVAVLLPLLVVIANEVGALEALMSRLSGVGAVAQSDLGRGLDAAQGADYVSKYFWFGTGPGTRISSLRTQRYGVAETLSIHHALLHVWVRFGVLGAVSYILLFAAPIYCAFRVLMQRTSDEHRAARRVLALSLASLLIGLFLWGLSTPALYINFRQGAVWMIAVVLLSVLATAHRPMPAPVPRRAPKQLGMAPS